MAKKVNSKHLPWYPFYSAIWLGSETVHNMSMTERGIYATLMAMCWQYGSITWEPVSLAKRLGIDRRTLGTFMDKYTHLTRTLHEGSKEVVLTKLQEFAETMGKSDGAGEADNTRIDNRHKTTAQRARRANVRVSVLETEANATTTATAKTSTPTTTQPTVAPLSQEPFDPLTFSSEITSKAGVPFSSEQVRRILSYHFNSDNPFWKERVNSAKFLAASIDTMASQVPADYELPAPKKPQTKIVGDKACKNCRGYGYKVAQSPTGNSRVDCTVCVPHKQVFQSGQWVDA